MQNRAYLIKTVEGDKVGLNYAPFVLSFHADTFLAGDIIESKRGISCKVVSKSGNTYTVILDPAIETDFCPSSELQETEEWGLFKRLYVN